MFWCIQIQPNLIQKQERHLSQNNKLVVLKYVIRSLAVINSVTGSPQGTVLSPVLFTLYTNDSTGTDTTPIIKYSDDSVIEDFPTQILFILLKLKGSATGAGIIPLT